MKYRELNADELATVQKFAKEYGREWKEYLQAAWLSYKHRGLHMGGQDTGTLRALRNELGCDWLRAFKLPK